MLPWPHANGGAETEDDNGVKATALASGLILIAAGGLATVRGSFGLGFLASLLGFALALARVTPHAAARYGGALLGACLLSVLLMPLHQAMRGQAPDSSPSPAVLPAGPSPGEALVAPAPGRSPSGLADEARRAIFAEVRQAEARAKREAIRVHPDGDANTARLNPEKEVRRAQKRLKVSRALEAESRKEIAGRHGLTEAQLEAIVREGAASGWPGPSDESPPPAPIPTPGT